MPTAYKVLGQLVPTANTAGQILYTCPASPTTQTVISSIVVCNRGTASGTFRIAIRPNAAALANQHYIVYDAPLAANSTTSFTLGITVDSSDLVEVYASTGNFSFNAYGSEIT